jgi:diguanylate cyclase (GGDEF)-like protein
VPTGDKGFQDAFVEIARALARGGDLDARIRSLATQARTLTGATVSVVYLLDGVSRALVPVAWDGFSEEEGAILATREARSVSATGEDVDAPAVSGAATQPNGPVRATGTEDSDPAVRVLHARHPELVDGAGAGLGSVRPNLAAVAYAPLVTEDANGGLEVEGVLAAGVDSPSADAARLLAVLGAVADLTAAAVRQSRLERALAERSDWVERVAQTDALTGLANRRTFDRVLELELARAARQGTPLCVAIFDIDGLETITSRHGAGAGDDVLRRVASAIADTVRLVDTIARYGGDEFALVAPGAAGRTVAERVLEEVDRLDMLNGREHVTLSAGIARFPEDGASAQELLVAADAALREAKQQGRGALAGPGATGERTPAS